MAMSQQEAKSEEQCARIMRKIQEKQRPLDKKAVFFVYEVAERYGVHMDTAFKGIRSGDPLYPRSHPLGTGPRPRIGIFREEIVECDKRRIKFYKTTPSWIKNYEDGDGTFPKRISAQKMFEASQG